MINKNLHLFFKFHEDNIGEFEGKQTMREHLNVYEKEGQVVWGHFTSKFSEKGLWDKKIDKMEVQIKKGREAFVFFCDKEKELLYVSRYIESYKKAEVEQEHPIMKYIPKYYHHKVGTPKIKIEKELRSYCYVNVTDVVKLSFREVEKIYPETNNNQNVLENKSMSSKFYVNLSDELYQKLEKNFKESDRKSLCDGDYEVILDEEVQDYLKTSDASISIIVEDIPQDKGEPISSKGRKRYKGKARITTNAIKLATHKCEFNNAHKSFISDVTNENYVEGHHLIPMAYQENFDNSIDVEANVVSLCPNCHKLVHHGRMEDKTPILSKLLKERKERLSKCEIDMNIRTLKKYYTE